MSRCSMAYLRECDAGSVVCIVGVQRREIARQSERERDRVSERECVREAE